MEWFWAINSWVNKLVWGWPTLVLLFGTGLILTIGLKFATWLGIGRAVKLVRENKCEGAPGISPRAALATALAATVGTGNIVGVATAIVLGGPGAVFYMWLIALFGMATTYSEAFCAVKFRRLSDRGERIGGPMYYLRDGVGAKFPKLGKILATLFALFGAVAAFGIGNGAQSNSIAAGLQESFSLPPIASGIMVMVVVGLVIIGGIKRIAQVADKLVPTMAVLYILGGIAVLVVFAARIPAAFAAIFAGAFSVKSAFAGSVGMAIRYGFARGVFSNEAGLGSASIAHAAAATNDPVRQGRIAMLGVFIDTIIVCSFTALAILVGGFLGDGSTGAALTTKTFNAAFPGGGVLVSVSLLLFAFTTILGWSYYGERCFEYLIGSSKWTMLYRIAFTAFVLVGSMLNLERMWSLADTLNGMMIIPNVVGLLILLPVIFQGAQKEVAQKAAAKAV